MPAHSRRPAHACTRVARVTCTCAGTGGHRVRACMYVGACGCDGRGTAACAQAGDRVGMQGSNGRCRRAWSWCAPSQPLRRNAATPRARTAMPVPSQMRWELGILLSTIGFSNRAIRSSCMRAARCAVLGPVLAACACSRATCSTHMHAAAPGQGEHRIFLCTPVTARERECVCVCVCVRMDYLPVHARHSERERMCVCVCMDYLPVHARHSERERICVCVCVHGLLQHAGVHRHAHTHTLVVVACGNLCV